MFLPPHSRFAGLAIATACLLAGLVAPARGDPLVDVRRLARDLGNADLLVLDASPRPQYAQGHIPGAVSLDAMTIAAFAVREVPAASIERTLQAHGVDPAKRIVLYDAGGTWFATRLYFTLHELGFPAKRLEILDGGLAKWRAEGLPVTKDASAAPNAGSFRIGAMRNDTRARPSELVAASGDRADKVLVDALGPEYYYGAARFFDRGGHIPHAALAPAEDFFNADRTFKSPDEIRRLARFLGVGPEREVIAHCGGGGAASVPYFALRFLAGYPRVRMSVESQYGWLQDDRDLPFWTYAAPSMMRRTDWLQAWGGKAMRMFGLSQVSIVDIRDPGAYAAGHLPYSVNVPLEKLRASASDPAGLGSLLGAAGVDPAHEAVIVSSAGLDKEAALAYALVERAGQRKVSVFVDRLDSIDVLEKLARSGFGLTREPPGFPARPYAPESGVAARAPADPTIPTVLVATGAASPVVPPSGGLVHAPAVPLLGTDGSPRTAADIWSALAKSGVPRYAELVTVADDPADAALGYFLLRLMGYARVSVRI